MIGIKSNELFTYNGLLFKSVERGFTCENCHFLALNDYNSRTTCQLQNDINNKVIQCKFDKTDYAYYKAQISDINDNKGKNIIETSWFRRGTTLILTGYRMGLNDFRIKTYKNSIYNKKVKKT